MSSDLSHQHLISPEKQQTKTAKTQEVCRASITGSTSPLELYTYQVIRSYLCQGDHGEFTIRMRGVLYFKLVKSEHPALMVFMTFVEVVCPFRDPWSQDVCLL